MQSEHCREFEDRSRNFPGFEQLLADVRLEEHARTCRPCSARRTEMQQLHLAVTRLKQRPLPVDLTTSVLQQWRNEQPAASRTGKHSLDEQSADTVAGEITRSVTARAGQHSVAGTQPARIPATRLSVPAPASEQSRPATLLALVMSVAVLLLAAVTMSSAPATRPVASGHQLAAGAVPAEAQPVETVPAERIEARIPLAGSSAGLPAPQAVPLDRLVWNAGNAWVGLTSATMTEVTTSALATTGAGVLSDSADLENPDVDWLRELKGTLGPVRDDLSRTVQFLIETLPLSDASTI